MAGRLPSPLGRLSLDKLRTTRLEVTVLAHRDYNPLGPSDRPGDMTKSDTQAKHDVEEELRRDQN